MQIQAGHVRPHLQDGHTAQIHEDVVVVAGVIDPHGHISEVALGNGHLDLEAFGRLLEDDPVRTGQRLERGARNGCGWLETEQQTQLV